MSSSVGWKLPTLAALLWVLVLGMWAAVATGPVGGPWGAAAGSVLTLIAGVVTGYIPSIRDGYRRRLEEWEQAVSALRRVRELPIASGPAGLLDPRRGVVKFIGRVDELTDLMTWCEQERARGVRLLTGPGGVGKTRLSVELCVRLTARGWRCEWPGDGVEGGALEAVRRLSRDRVLLVVDYAETRTDLGALLRSVAADDGHVRVLLLARSQGEWWDRLAAREPAVRELLSAAEAGSQLPVVVAAGLSNEEVVTAAAPAFAAELGVPPPERVAVEAGPGATRVLDLHAAALVAALRSVGDAPVTVVVGGVLDELLGHEARFWQGSADRLGLTVGVSGLTTAQLRQIVAAGALLGAASREEAIALLERVPGVAGSVKVAEWLRQVYPPPGRLDGFWLGSLAPDRLAERLVVAELGRDAMLADRCLTGLDGRQALRAVTILGRASADEERAEDLLKRLLPLVEQVVADLPGDLRLLEALQGAVPYPSTALAGADLAITRRILALLPPGQVSARARWLNWLGVALAQDGQTTEATRATEEAVTLCRELAVDNPDRFRPNLAAAVSNLGTRRSEVGQPADALSATEEAVALYRELAAANPDRFRADLAASLSNLGGRLSELGRLAEALSAGEEAVAIHRELAASNPARFRADLAGSLNNFSAFSFRLGQVEALSAAEEAAAIRRELAATDPDRYWPDLAATLSNLGVWLSARRRSADALKVTEEAAAIQRQLIGINRERFRPGLADALSNLGTRLIDLGRPQDALPVAEEAAAIRRELAAANPDRFRPDLAMSLSNVGVCLSELGRLRDALLVTEEAAEIRRELATANPRFRPDLADTLTNLGVLLSRTGRAAEAIRETEEAVAIRRELARTNSGFRPELANSLSNLGVFLSESGRTDHALGVTEEAVAICRELAAADRERFLPGLAQALSNLGARLSEAGRSIDALPVSTEAVDLYRELAAGNDRYQPNLASSLTNLGVRFSELGLSASALNASKEAVALFRELAKANPERYHPDLAASLSNLGVRLSERGRLSEALPISEEAVSLFRDLTTTSHDRYRPGLAASLLNLGIRFGQLGRPADALQMIEESTVIRRELFAGNVDRFRGDLAESLMNLGVCFTAVGRPQDALPVTEEAVAAFGELAANNPRYEARLTVALGNLSAIRERLGGTT